LLFVTHVSRHLNFFGVRTRAAAGSPRVELLLARSLEVCLIVGTCLYTA
jgi:hypothetical protein